MALKNVGRLDCADICWKENRLWSKKYQDLYFSRENGLAESREVFLKGAHLESRFQTLAEKKTGEIRILPLVSLVLVQD